MAASSNVAYITTTTGTTGRPTQVCFSGREIRALQTLDAIYNVAVGEQTSLNQLFNHLKTGLSSRYPDLATSPPVHGEFRAADVRHSLADIGAARRLLGYEPSHRIVDGLEDALGWYVTRFGLPPSCLPPSQ